MDTGTDFTNQVRRSNKTNDMEAIRPILRECYDFIADVIFENSLLDKNILTVWMLVNY